MRTADMAVRICGQGPLWAL